MTTVFALSSGRPPAAIAIVRISGPAAMSAVEALAGPLPAPRRAGVRTLRDADGTMLDRAIVLTFPGPATATGEDLVELHLHGGRAVVAAVERALAAMPDLRPALAGEFTRRALENGRLDLAQAEGLADLLSAETEGERRAALAASDGAVGRMLRGWMDRLSAISALVEAAIDYSDEEDVEETADAPIRADLAHLADEWAEVLRRPSVERLRDGATVILAGPPNAGKSSLFNALIEREASIVTPVAGTTRDVIEASVIRAGIAYRLVDTAGLSATTDDVVERIGIDRARRAAAGADLVLWLGDEDACPDGAIQLWAKCDVSVRVNGMPVSVHRPETVRALWQRIVATLEHSMVHDDMRLHEHHRTTLGEALLALRDATSSHDWLIVAEGLRRSRTILGSIIGIDATEAMLDALFSRFCIGK